MRWRRAAQRSRSIMSIRSARCAIPILHGIRKSPIRSRSISISSTSTPPSWLPPTFSFRRLCGRSTITSASGFGNWRNSRMSGVSAWGCWTKSGPPRSLSAKVSAKKPLFLFEQSLMRSVLQPTTPVHAVGSTSRKTSSSTSPCMTATAPSSVKTRWGLSPPISGLSRSRIRRWGWSSR